MGNSGNVNLLTMKLKEFQGKVCLARKSDHVTILHRPRTDDAENRGDQGARARDTFDIIVVNVQNLVYTKIQYLYI